MAVALFALSVGLLVVTLSQGMQRAGELLPLSIAALGAHLVVAILPWPTLIERPVGLWLVRGYVATIIVIVVVAYETLEGLPPMVLLLPALTLILTATILTILDHLITTAVVVAILAAGAPMDDALSTFVLTSVVALGSLAWGVAAHSLRRAWEGLEEARTRADLEAERLRQVEEGREDALAMIVHEIKNRLHIVLAATETVAQRYEELEAGQVIGFSSRAHDHADIIGRIVDALEVLTTAGRADPSRFEIVPLAPIVDEVVSWVRDVAAAHRLVMHVPHDVRVIAEPVLLQQALENLVANAVRHTPPGTTVTVRAEPESSDGVRVTVADDGPGIPPDDRERILEPFYRPEGLFGEADDELGLDLGLGLAVVSRVLRAHGSELTVHDREPGSGAALSFVIPVGRNSPSPE